MRVHLARDKQQVSRFNGEDDSSGIRSRMSMPAWSNLALTHGGPSKLLAIGRRSRQGGGGQKRLERGKESTQLMRPRARSRARQLIRTRTHLRAAPGIFIEYSRRTRSFRIRARARACSRLHERYPVYAQAALTHSSSVLLSLVARERATVIKPINDVMEIRLRR